jgi:FkbM family methyltransferase
MNKLTKLLTILKTPGLSKPLLKHGTAAGVEHLCVLRSLGKMEIATIIDIGANRGQFALAARTVFPTARIIAFEPLQEAADTFKRVFCGDPLVTLHQTAIGREIKESSIHVSRSDDSSSLLPISALQNMLFPNTDEKETRVVSVRRLEDLESSAEIKTPALMKIDVQGFEMEVLVGTGTLLEKFASVYVECSFMELYTGQALAHEVIDLMHKRGFRLQGVYNLGYDKSGAAVQGDFLFINTKIHKQSK